MKTNKPLVKTWPSLALSSSMIAAMMFASPRIQAHETTMTTRTTAQQALLGQWMYADCTIKNTSVHGVLTITVDTLRFDGEVTQDYPTQPHQSSIPYHAKGNQLIFKNIEGDAGVPVMEYFLIIDGDLYFSRSPIKKPQYVNESDRRFGANWIYKLQKVQ